MESKYETPGFQTRRELKKREKSNFVELVHEIFVNLGDPTNDLASMLVTPVQRIPRYVLMLKDLLKHTSPQHPDYNNLLKAVKIMTDTTVLVDRKADDAKSSQKVLEVADLILDSPVSIVQPNRKWVKDGPVNLVVSVNDIPIVHELNLFKENAFCEESGEYEIKSKISALGLYPGVYKINVFFADNFLKQKFDSIMSACSFEIILDQKRDYYYQTGSAIYKEQNTSWEIKKI